MGRTISSTAKANLDAAMVAAYGDTEALTVPCVWCGVTLDALYDVERDRRVPGAGYNLQNVAPACRPCNGARGDATGGDWDERYTAYPLSARMTPAPEVARRMRRARGARRDQEVAAAAARRAAIRATR